MKRRAAQVSFRGTESEHILAAGCQMWNRRKNLPLELFTNTFKDTSAHHWDPSYVPPAVWVGTFEPTHLQPTFCCDCASTYIFLVTWNRMCAGTHIPGSVCDNQERDLKAQPTGEALGWLQTSNIPCDKELLASFICKLEPAYSWSSWDTGWHLHGSLWNGGAFFRRGVFWCLY